MRRDAKRFINHIKTERGLSRETVESYQDDLKKFIEFVEAKKGTTRKTPVLMKPSRSCRTL